MKRYQHSPSPLYLTIPEVCVTLGLGRTKVYDLIKQAYGTCVHVVRHKGGGGLRPMNGYRLPLQAMAQLLVGLEELPLLWTAEWISACSSAGPFSHSLN